VTDWLLRQPVQHCAIQALALQRGLFGGDHSGGYMHDGGAQPARFLAKARLS
jgi:hypothetical protein